MIRRFIRLWLVSCVALLLSTAVHAATPAKPAAPAHKGAARKKRPPPPMYPARTNVQTAVVVSEVLVSWGSPGATRLRMRYRLAPPEGACPNGLHLFVPLGYPGNPVSFSARWGVRKSEGVALRIERAPLLQPWAHALAGPTNTAGIVAHVPRSELAGWCGGAEAQLELEQEIPTPKAGPNGTAEIVIPMRSGAWGPLGLERIAARDVYCLYGDYSGPDEPKNIRWACNEGDAVLSTAHWCNGGTYGARLLVAQGLGLPSLGPEFSHSWSTQTPALSTRRGEDDLCMSVKVPATPPWSPDPE